MSKQDYQLLEIVDDDKLTIEMIRKAYKRMIIKYHPDKNKDNQEGLNKIQLIIKAYKNIMKKWNQKEEKKTNGINFEEINKKYFN